MRKVNCLSFSFLFLLLIHFAKAYSHGGPSQKLPASVLMEQPMSVTDLPCGEYLIAGKIQTWPSGEDVIILYPETEREFSVPLYGLTTKESFSYNNILGLYRVNYPLTKEGKRQGRFYFQKFVTLASLAQVYEKPVSRMGSSCKLPQ